MNETDWFGVLSGETDVTEENELIEQFASEILGGGHKPSEYEGRLSALGFARLCGKVCFERANADRKHSGKASGNATERKSFAQKLVVDGKQVFITRHAVERLRSRQRDLLEKTDEEIRKWIVSMFEKGNVRKATLKFKYSAAQILGHGFEKAEYWIDSSGFVYVIADGVLKTVHHNEAKRWTV